MAKLPEEEPVSLYMRLQMVSIVVQLSRQKCKFFYNELIYVIE